MPKRRVYKNKHPAGKFIGGQLKEAFNKYYGFEPDYNGDTSAFNKTVPVAIKVFGGKVIKNT